LLALASRLVAPPHRRTVAMSTQLSEDQVTRLCQDLIYQVSYAFYDTPYILLLKLIVHLGV
jgi:transcription initiation factor TFIIE subunit alpha